MDFVFENGGYAHDEGLFPLLHDPIADLYDNWFKSEWSRQKYMQYLLLKKIPGVSANIDIYEGMADNQAYLDRYKMDWSDVRNPKRLPGTSQVLSGYAGGINFVSTNLHRLYR